VPSVPVSKPEKQPLPAAQSFLLLLGLLCILLSFSPLFVSRINRMSLEGDRQVNPKSDARDHEAGNERRKTQDKLPTIGNPLQPPPAPPANPPPDNKPNQRRENTKLGLEIIGLAVLIAYTIFSGLQWLQIRWTNRLTREALNGSNVSLQQTLQKMQNQIDQMSRLADNAGRQADRAKDLADRAHDQAVATKQAADAATSAAATAKDTLHISEKAYIVTGATEMDAAKKTVTIPIVNSGHIPSGRVEITVHEATVFSIAPERRTNLRNTVERHWSRNHLDSVSPGLPMSTLVPVAEIDETKLNGGYQAIFVAGYIVYNDGFPDTPDQRLPFCTHTTYHAAIKQVFWIECDPAEMVPKLESIDGYPNNEAK
jgi:hypothetical protein